MKHLSPTRKKKLAMRGWARFLFTLALLGLLGAGSAPAAEAKDNAQAFKIFSGEPRLVVVHGYSTSYHWWAMLQRKIDRFQSKKRTVEVNLVARGGTPIAKWIDLAGGEPLEPWKERLRPVLKSAGERPVVVAAQQSLQWVYGDRREGIRDAADKARITQGADAIETYARLMAAEGAELVFVAMHIYKTGMEPEIGNERLALTEALKRDIPRLRAGPDVWQPTSQAWPHAFAEDKVHPNSIGAEIMAHYWFAALLEHDGLAVPEWSRREMEQAIEGQPLGLRRNREMFPDLLTEWGISSAAQAPWRR